MSGGISPRHAQNPLSGERRKTLSITHHALSPPPPHHHLYTSHLINWLQRFYRITMSLKHVKRPFVPKSDVKQRFTTTTTTFNKPHLRCEGMVIDCLIFLQQAYLSIFHVMPCEYLSFIPCHCGLFK